MADGTQKKAEAIAISIAPLTINQRLAAVMRDVQAIAKEKKNTQQNFNYRGIDDVYNMINPVLAKHGVFMSARIIEKSREERLAGAQGKTVLTFTSLRMSYTFHGEDGGEVSTEAEGEGFDSGDKSTNKAMAVAHKYALLQAFCIPTDKIDDPDAESFSEIQPRQQARRQEEAPPKPSADNGRPKHVVEAERILTALKGAKSRAELEDTYSRENEALEAIRSVSETTHDYLFNKVGDMRKNLPA